MNTGVLKGRASRLSFGEFILFLLFRFTKKRQSMWGIAVFCCLSSCINNTEKLLKYSDRLKVKNIMRQDNYRYNDKDADGQVPQLHRFCLLLHKWHWDQIAVGIMAFDSGRKHQRQNGTNQTSQRDWNRFPAPWKQWPVLPVYTEAVEEPPGGGVTG